MSVLNQMLRDLEKRGAMPDLVAAAGTATVARPALPLSQRPTSTGRRRISVGVFAIAAGFVGVHTWLSQQAQHAGDVRGPLGAKQFGSVVQPDVPAAQVAASTPAPQVASTDSRSSAVVAAPPVQLSSPLVPSAAPAAPKPVAIAPRAPRVSSAPRDAAPALKPAPSAPAQAVASEPAVPPAVVRSSGDVTRDVDRAADLIARGRANEAMELLVQVLNRQPTHVAARSSLAALLAEAGRREQALHVLLAGSEVDAGTFAMPAAQLQAELGNLSGALQTLARVPLARRNGGYEGLHAGLAQRAGDHMTAIAAYRRALAQPQPDPVWWVGLGVSLEAFGEPADARTAYSRAAADPKLPADIRRYTSERLTFLDAHALRGEDARRASLANVF